MKYETPQLTALTPAINAIQGTGSGPDKTDQIHEDGLQKEVPSAAYQDWE
jgi:hypothetical protein